MIKENDTELEWLFVLAKLDDHEGLLYFKPVVEEIDEVEVSNLVPQCIIIDGAKYVYTDELDKKLTVNAINDVITFCRVDGIQLNIDTNEIGGFPFEISQFKDTPMSLKPVKPENFVEVSD